ncbi:hypothetical protein K3495_g11172 [Podosphaera aphanis]|nr:hypothetical protein K3495_g11172 [Podosphaera aphanis]
MAVQAKVTLRALNSNIFPPERVIHLSPAKPYISIGRASKNPSKALYGSIDNAWFDSPVMSRDHARLSLDLESKTLSIQDIGSMHGTHVNDSQLISHIPIIVRDGDIIVFGAEVKRGPETYMACKFGVNYEISQYRSSNTFAFPESSDGDDEIKLSDDDLGRAEADMSFKRRRESIKSLPGVFPEVGKDVDYDRDQPSLSNEIGNNEETHGKSEDNFSNFSESDVKPASSTDQASEISPDFIDYDDNDTCGLNLSCSKGSEAVLFYRKVVKTRTQNCDDKADKISHETWNYMPETSNKSCNTISSVDEDNPIIEENPMANHSEHKGVIRSKIGNFEVFDDDTGASFDESSKSDDSYISNQVHEFNDFGEIRDQARITTDIDKSNSTRLDEIDVNSSTTDQDHHTMPTVTDSTVRPSTDNKYLGPYDMITLNQSNTRSGKGSRDVRLPWNHFLAHNTGKSAYFRARELNKAKYNSMENISENTYTSYIFSGRNQRRSPLAIGNLNIFSDKKFEAFPVSNEQRKTCPKRVPESGHNGLLDPQDQDFAPGSGSATGNRIDELDDTEISASCLNKNNKRKADSNASEFFEETQNLTKFPRITPGKIFASKVSKIKAHNHRKLAKIKDRPSNFDLRPTKRQKVLESFRYMAIGGITAAAGLFSVLVATAPEL